MATSALPDPLPLRDSLRAHDVAFTKLLSLIPARYYLPSTDEEIDSKFMKNKKKRPAAELQEMKKKARRDKLDPAQHKTIPEIQAERAAAAAAANEEDGEGVPAPTAPSAAPTTLRPMAPAADIATLREKLQAKLDSFKRRKGAPATAASAGDPDDASLDLDAAGSDADSDADADASSDDAMTGGGGDGAPRSRDELMEATRRRRGEVRDKRRTRRKAERRAEKETAASKSKKVVRVDPAAGKQGKQGEADKAAKGKAKEDYKARPGKGGTNLLVDPLPRDGGDASSTSGPASTGTLSFGHLALPSSSTLTPARKAPLKTLSNPTQALAHLQARKERLAELPSDKREAVEARERWATALERAEGGKVRDDEGRLKKAAKRVEKQKAKSGKEWQDRKKAASASQAIKLKKRSENIAARSEARKNKKLGLKPKGDKDKKKGGPSGGYKGKNKGRPGFEGGRPGKKPSAGGGGGGAGGGKK